MRINIGKPKQAPAPKKRMSRGDYNLITEQLKSREFKERFSEHAKKNPAFQAALIKHATGFNITADDLRPEILN